MEDSPYSCNADDKQELHPRHCLAELAQDTGAYKNHAKDVELNWSNTASVRQSSPIALTNVNHQNHVVGKDRRLLSCAFGLRKSLIPMQKVLFMQLTKCPTIGNHHHTPISHPIIAVINVSNRTCSSNVYTLIRSGDQLSKRVEVEV